ncbi:hypothetical protein ACVWYI_000663 [Bradyrhizobium sp. LB13.1]
MSITWSRPAHDDVVDDLLRVADQLRGDVAGLLGLDRARHRAGQHHAVADAFDLHARQRLTQRRTHAVEVALHRDVIGGDLLAVGAEEHDVGLADLCADDIGALGRADHRIGNLGIGHQHVLDLARQVDDGGFADAERQEARPRRRDRRDRCHIEIRCLHRRLVADRRICGADDLGGCEEPQDQHRPRPERARAIPPNAHAGPIIPVVHHVPITSVTSVAAPARRSE